MAASENPPPVPAPEVVGLPSAVPAAPAPEPTLEAVVLATAERVELLEARMDEKDATPTLTEVIMAKPKEAEKEPEEVQEPGEETPAPESSLLAPVVAFFNWLGDF